MAKVTKMIYPSGFYRTASAEEREINSLPLFVSKEYEPNVDSMYRSYLIIDHKHIPWLYRSNALKTISRLFLDNGGGYRNFVSWAEQQLATNNYLYDLNYEFLVDTLNYLVTGKRQMEVPQWADIITKKPVHREGVANYNRVEQNKEALNYISVNDPIVLWCSREGGFDDLVFTINLMFGKLS